MVPRYQLQKIRASYQKLRDQYEDALNLIKEVDTVSLDQLRKTLDFSKHEDSKAQFLKDQVIQSEKKNK